MIVFDTETTGLTLPSSADLKAQPKIIELAAIVMDSGRVIDERVWLINPGEKLSPEITKITGLTDADLADKPSFIEVLPELIDVFLGKRRLIAHNLPFDLAVLVAELKRCGREYAFPFPPDQLCTVSAYAHLRGHNLKLTELYAQLLGKEFAQSHRALGDARALAEIVAKEGL